MTILNDTSLFTYPSDKPDRCIDYIMVDTPHLNKVSVTERRVITNSEASDHCAVIVKAELNAND